MAVEVIVGTATGVQIGVEATALAMLNIDDVTESSNAEQVELTDENNEIIALAVMRKGDKTFAVKGVILGAFPVPGDEVTFTDDNAVSMVCVVMNDISVTQTKGAWRTGSFSVRYYAAMVFPV